MTKSKFSMNVLPVILILVLIFGAGYLLLKDTLKLPWFKDDKNIEITRIEGFPKMWLTDKQIKKIRVVIENKAELQEFFAHADMLSDQATLEAILSKVNFDKEVLLGATTDTQEETEGMIKIKRVEVNKAKKKLHVKIYQYKPDASCVPEVKNNVLVDLVKIDRTDYKIEFDVIKQERSCD